MTYDDLRMGHNGLTPEKEQQTLDLYRVLFKTLSSIDELNNIVNGNGYGKVTLNMAGILRDCKVDLQKMYDRLYRAAMRVTGELVKPQAIDDVLVNTIREYNINKEAEEAEKTEGSEYEGDG